MPPERSTVESHDADEPAFGYRWLGVAAGLAMIGVVAVAALGLVTPDVLTLEQYVVALAGTTGVLALTIIASLFMLDRTFSELERHRAAIDAQQDAILEAREEAWERHQEVQDRRFGERIDQVDARVDELDAEHAALTQRTRGTAMPTPFGDIHNLYTVRGISEEERQELASVGVEDTEQLWMANAHALAERLDHDTATVRAWQRQAELMALPRVDSRGAEVLARSGVLSVPDLASWDPDRLLDRIRERHLDVYESGEPVADRKQVEMWIGNARAHDPSAYRVHRHGHGSPTPAH